MNATSHSPVTPEHQEAYLRDGVVLVRGAIDREWIDLLLSTWEAMRRTMAESPASAYRLPEDFLARDPALAEEIASIRSDDAAQHSVYTEQSPGFTRCKYMRWWSPEFEAFATQSSAAEIVGRVIGAHSIRFFLDAMFMKAPGLKTKTYWHPDSSAWPTRSQQVPTMWMPLLPVDRNLSCLEFVAGSHSDTRLPWPNTFNAKRIPRPSDALTFIDYEARRGEEGLRFLSFDMEPGDVIVIHPRTYHGGGANLHPTQPRIALSTRWFGEDVTWDPRPECINTPGLPLSEMVPGGRPVDDRLFPLAWKRDGGP